MKTFKILSKVALLLVIFGFFQPVACEQQGFDLADTLMEFGEFKYTTPKFGDFSTCIYIVMGLKYGYRKVGEIHNG